jgi:hypothetical protein
VRPVTAGKNDLSPVKSALSPNTKATEYRGELETHSLSLAFDDAGSGVLPAYEIEVIATHKGTEISREAVRVMILPDLHELVQPRVQVDVLEHLAVVAGGRTLRGTADLFGLLKELPVIPGASIVSRQPLWDTVWLWLMILTLLGIEWSLRRFSGYG